MQLQRPPNARGAVAARPAAAAAADVPAQGPSSHSGAGAGQAPARLTQDGGGSGGRSMLRSHSLPAAAVGPLAAAHGGGTKPSGRALPPAARGGSALQQGSMVVVGAVRRLGGRLGIGGGGGGEAAVGGPGGPSVSVVVAAGRRLSDGGGEAGREGTLGGGRPRSIVVFHGDAGGEEAGEGGDGGRPLDRGSWAQDSDAAGLPAVGEEEAARSTGPGSVAGGGVAGGRGEEDRRPGGGGLGRKLGRALQRMGSRARGGRRPDADGHDVEEGGLQVGKGSRLGSGMLHGAPPPPMMLSLPEMEAAAGHALGVYGDLEQYIGACWFRFEIQMNGTRLLGG